MYVGHVNWFVIECHVAEYASRGNNICGKIVKIVSGASGAREPFDEADSGDDSCDPKDAIRLKKKSLNIVALKRVGAMAKRL